eukprot:14568442-Alexandrium_andersonii.AAC.1
MSASLVGSEMCIRDRAQNRRGQDLRRDMLVNKRAQRIMDLNAKSGGSEGAHLLVGFDMVRALRGPKGPLSPLPAGWWRARCRCGSHAPKNILDVRCGVKKNDSIKQRRE